MAELGLEVIEHTTNHQRGVDRMVETDACVRDTYMHIALPAVEKQRKELRTVFQFSSRRNLIQFAASSRNSPNGSMRMSLSAENF
jgi:hypothetical protein